MARAAVTIDGSHLSIDEVVAVARDQSRVRLSSRAVAHMRASRRWVEEAVRQHAVVYGITTGFGAFQNVSIESNRLRELQRNLILSHCAGVGEPFPEEVVRAMMLLRINALAKGYSGIRNEVVQRLLEMLNRGVHPVIPSQGSVGASGDLAPLSHMAAVLIGEGEAVFRGKVMSGASAMKAARLKTVVLEAKEGIALNNGTQAMTAIGVLALRDAERLADVADIGVSMTLEAIKGRSAPFDRRVHSIRPHPGQEESARRVRSHTTGSTLIDRLDHDTRAHVQDSYSVRCAPQVHGASRDALVYVRRVLEREINSATDNPLIFPKEGQAISAGNFHGQPIALAMDFLALAVAELGNIAERRIAKLLDKNHNHGLPPFLVRDGGVRSGLMISQYTAASLVSENKVLMHPASGDSIPTSANQEDHVSMGTISARHAAEIIGNVARILAIELLCATRAIEHRLADNFAGTRIKLGSGTAKACDSIRRTVDMSDADKPLQRDIETVAVLIMGKAFSHIIQPKRGS